MPRAQRYVNLGAVIVPFVAVGVAIVLLWQQIVDEFDLALFATMYLLTAFGITVGYHRHFTHRAFDTPRPMQLAFAILGSMAVQGAVTDWVADHRKHHAHTDEEGDPHSPHGEGAWWKGLLWAHMGWLMETCGQADRERYARELTEDRTMAWIDKLNVLWITLGLLIPAAAGWAWHGDLAGAARGLLWGGLVRVFFVHHVTWSINSICHFFGTRRFALEDHSTNVFWLALPSLGEAWHHNHHAFPRSAFHGLRWYELDPSGWAIRAMARIGLARNVIRIAPERQQQLLAEPPG